MVMVKRCGILMVVLGAAAMLVAPARADEGAEAKKAVDAFVAAWRTGDEKAILGTLVVPAAREEDIRAVVESMAAISRLQDAATKKFGAVSAADYFAEGSGQFETRLKGIKEGPVKVMGESAILTIPADETTKTQGGTIILVKSGATWKIEGASLFNMTPERQKETAELVAFSGKLTPIANQMKKEIVEGKYAAAVDAYQEFFTRYTAALKEMDARPATVPATRGK